MSWLGFFFFFRIAVAVSSSCNTGQSRPEAIFKPRSKTNVLGLCARDIAAETSQSTLIAIGGVFALSQSRRANAALGQNLRQVGLLLVLFRFGSHLVLSACCKQSPSIWRRGVRGTWPEPGAERCGMEEFAAALHGEIEGRSAKMQKCGRRG